MTEPTPLMAAFSAADPGVSGVFPLAPGVALGWGGEPGRAALWAITSGGVVALGDYADRSLERAHSALPVVDPVRRHVWVLVGDTVQVRTLDTLTLIDLWPLPKDDSFWEARLDGGALALRGTGLLALDAGSGATLWRQPTEAPRDWRRVPDGGWVTVHAQHDPQYARLTRRWHTAAGVHDETLSFVADAGPILSVGDVRLLRGGGAFLCVLTHLEGGHAVSRLLRYDRVWRTLSTWRAAQGPEVFGVVELSTDGEDWALARGYNAEGRRQAQLIHTSTGASMRVTPRAMAEGAWVISPPDLLSNAETGARWRLTPTPERAVALSPTGGGVFALVGDQVVGWVVECSANP